MSESTGGDPKAATMERLLVREVHLARMATADPDTRQPHVVPVWFRWDGQQVWIHSYRTTRKIRHLEGNPRLAVVVDVDEGGKIAGELLEGPAELVSQPKELVVEMATQVYLRYLGPEGVLAPDPQEWIHAPESLMIRMIPEQISVW
jgi:hypothetical protein